jgi:GGDEF domain-containing protein
MADSDCYHIARLVVDELELRLIASIDALTGLMRRRALTDAARRHVARALRYHGA